MKTRYLSLILAIVMLMGLIPMTVTAAAKETVRTTMNFESSALTNEEFSTSLDATKIGGPTFIGGSSIMITKTDAPHGKAARIQNTDMRWWSMNLSEDNYRTTLTVVPYQCDGLSVHLSINTQDPVTGTEGLDGTAVYFVSNADGKPVIWNYQREEVYVMEWGKPYKVDVLMSRGSDQYEILVNDTSVKKDNTFVSPVHSVNGLRFHVWPGSDILVDDFQLTTWGRVFPQEYSTQAPGEMPEINYPGEWVDTGEYRVYHNTVRQDFSQKDIVAVKGDVWLNAEKVLPLIKGDAVVTLDGDKQTATLGDRTVDLSSYLSVRNDMQMISLTAINKIFGAKVWFDEAERMVILTTGSYTNDNFLRACDHKFVMNGEPYYEISFDKFDLSGNIFTYLFNGKEDPSLLAAEEKSLQTLHDNGFKTIRVFLNNPWILKPEHFRTEEGKKAYYEGIDYVLDLCDKYDIKIVASLMLEESFFWDAQEIDGEWVYTGEIMADIVSDPNCKSRQFMYDYLEEFIPRYKDRDTILMWEVSNEIALDTDVGPAVQTVLHSALQVGEFYSSITSLVNSLDQNHLIDSGDAGLRGSQYNLLLDTMAGRPCTWKADTQEEHNMALWIINQGINVMSGHCPNESLSYFENLMNCSRAFGKPYYMGETVTYGDYTMLDPEALPAQKAHLETLTESGLQLIHWWDFDAPLSREDYKKEWNVTLETCPDTFYAIAEANKRHQAKWMVNGVNAPATPESSLLSGNKVPFTDVPADAWYYGDVVTAYHSGLINGTSASTYAPANELLYCEAVKLAACMNQKTYEGNVTLTVGDPWYQPYVDYASANGIIAGEYDWNAKATRAGYLSIFANALKDADLAPINEVPDGSIPDVPMTHPQADAIYKLYRAGIIQGTDEAHSCSPDTNISRSEMAAILTRMMDATKRVTFTMG